MGQRLHNEADLSKLRAALMRWYRTHHRKLPWRAAPGAQANPYHVLVSEAMLQQTQVATVIDYFNRFIQKFKTIQSLAAADEQEVLRLWQGLGYYRRARHLHAAARMIVADHHGQIPDTVETLSKLPGVGPYTAGAIASIAFRRAEPVVDGNVERVLARLWAICSDPQTPAARKRFWALARQWVPKHPRSHPGDFNQAVMELGATVCTPRDPACGQCSLRRYCQAYKKSIIDRCPPVKRRVRQRPVTHRVLGLVRGGRLLMEQRGSSGLWPTLWQMPTLEDNADLRRHILDRFGLQIGPAREVDSFVHLTTHLKIKFVVSHAPLLGGRLKRGAAMWRTPHQLQEHPMANPQHRATKMILQSQMLAST
jgi:A/G-specific adenine glycosylase